MDDQTQQPANPASPAKPDKKRRRRIPNPVRIVIALVLYVLSIGPMFWFWYEAENMGGWPIMRLIYFPLRLLCRFEIVEEWLNEYINWWIG